MKPFRTRPPSRANSVRDDWLILPTASRSIPAEVQNLSTLRWNRRLSPVSFRWQEAEQRSRLGPAEDGACFHYRRCFLCEDKRPHRGTPRAPPGSFERKRFKIERWSFSRGCWCHRSTRGDGKGDDSTVYHSSFPSFMRHRANIKAEA